MLPELLKPVHKTNELRGLKDWCATCADRYSSSMSSWLYTLLHPGVGLHKPASLGWWCSGSDSSSFPSQLWTVESRGIRNVMGGVLLQRHVQQMEMHHLISTRHLTPCRPPSRHGAANLSRLGALCICSGRGCPPRLQVLTQHAAQTPTAVSSCHEIWMSRAADPLQSDTCWLLIWSSSRALWTLGPKDAHPLLLLDVILMYVMLFSLSFILSVLSRSPCSPLPLTC